MDNEIMELTRCFVEALHPVKIYLFGSFAYGTPNENSDYDFYIVVDEAAENLFELTCKAYKSIREKRKRPVDIMVGTVEGFDKRKDEMYLEKDVYNKGVLLYE